MNKVHLTTLTLGFPQRKAHTDNRVKSIPEYKYKHEDKGLR